MTDTTETLVLHICRICGEPIRPNTGCCTFESGVVHVACENKQTFDRFAEKITKKIERRARRAKR